LAITVGGLEVVVKMFLYFFHERLWDKIKFGKVEITPFVIWFTGLPLSGKTTLANGVYKKIKDLGLKAERLDSRDVRALFPEEGFDRVSRYRHIKRVGHLASILEKNGICVIASFVSPYVESRNFVRSICKNFVEVYVKASLELCMRRDTRGIYERAKRGQIKNFTGISDVYEEPLTPEIVLDTDTLSIKDLVNIVFSYVRDRFLKRK